jgi:hypothetical protein
MTYALTIDTAIQQQEDGRETGVRLVIRVFAQPTFEYSQKIVYVPGFHMHHYMHT